MFKLRADYAKQLEGYSIFISFWYNANYVNLVKSLPIRKWDNNNKWWEIPLDSRVQLLELLSQNNIPYNQEEFNKSMEDLREKVKQSEERYKAEQNISLDEIKFKLEPREYQKEGILYGLNHDKYLLADQPGLGKTLQLINISRLKRGGQYCLIITGYDALQYNWLNEIEKCSDEKAYVLGSRILKSGANKGNLRKGNMEERIYDLNNIPRDVFFLITNVSTLRYGEKVKYTGKDGKEKSYHNFIVADQIENLCRQGLIGRVIFDEAHVVKSPTALQTQALLKIKSCPYKVLATGTPIMNKHIDLYPLMTWLGYETSNYYSFRERYCKMGGFQNKQIVGNKNGDELNKRLSTFMLRRKKEDVLDLPEKIIIDETLEMEFKQASLYHKIMKQAKADLSKMRGNKAALLALMIKLRQITCHPQWVDEKYKDSVKFERVHQLIEEITENNEKCIIFSNWSTPIGWLYDELKEYNPAMITGATKDRMAEVNKFQNDDSCKIILGTGGAMGTGLTLTAATNEIFIDEPWNKPTKDQWEDRAHRIGTKKNVNIYTLICKNTYDEKVHKTVIKKGLVADNVVDGIDITEFENYINNY